MKRRTLLIIIVSVVVVASIVLGVSIWFFVQQIERLRIGAVALIELSGTISYSGASLNIVSSGSITPSDVKYYVDQALSDPSIRAVVISINSPGGSAAASEEIYQLIKRLAESKPVVVYSPEVLASGGYYISLPAQKIVVNPHALVGSVGAVMEVVNIEDLLNKLGVNVTVLKSGVYKDITSPFRPLTQKEVGILQDIVNKTAQIFIERVREHRKISDSEVFQARIYLGEDAVKVGLADYVGTLDNAVDIARQLAGLSPQAPVVKIEKPKSLLQQLLGLDIEIKGVEIKIGGVSNLENSLSTEFVGKPLYLWIPSQS